ncbi:hypothetical protein ACIG87_27485 [Micromonospora sp. NPDC051925]|uniref:hypothetical protein n=1 Tax=Micromonospora sp. NPDC051925 TaxID=3364288 RepID=UPI0037C93BAF
MEIIDGDAFSIGGFRPAHTRRARNVRSGNTKVALPIDDAGFKQRVVEHGNGGT